MPEIYGLAHFVVAWLGEANASMEKGAALAAQLLTIIEELTETRGPELAWHFWDLTFAELEELGIPGATDPAWDGFLEIMRRP